MRGGISRSQYEGGASLSGARGHSKTPEHGLKSARKNPQKYGDYLRKRTVPSGGGPPSSLKVDAEDEAYALNLYRDAAYWNIYGRLHQYYKYRDRTVLANVYGGTTPESGNVPGMDMDEARWTANADTEELRANASQQYQGNPWFYH